MSSDTNQDHGSSPPSHQNTLYHECSLGLYRAWDRLAHSDSSASSGLIPFLFTCLDHLQLLLPEPESYALKIAAQRPGSPLEWQILSTCEGHITKEKDPLGDEWSEVGKRPGCTLRLDLEPIDPDRTVSREARKELARAIGELRGQLNHTRHPSAGTDLIDEIAARLEDAVFKLSQQPDRTDRAEENERVASQPDEKGIKEIAERAARHLAGHIVELNDTGDYEDDRTTFAIRTVIPDSEAGSHVWIAKPGSRRRLFGRRVIEHVELSDARVDEPQLAPALHRAFKSGFLTRGRRTNEAGHDCHVLCIPCHFEGVPWTVICFEYKMEDDPVRASLSQLRAFWKYEEISRGTTADVRQEGQAALGAAMDRLWRRATNNLPFHNEKSVMKSINDEWNQLGYVFPVCPIVKVKARNSMLPMLHPWPFDLGTTKSTPFLETATLVPGSADDMWAQAPETTSEWQVPRIEMFFWEYSRKAPDRLGEDLVQVEEIKEFIRQKDCGIIVVTGAAGIGKTTTFENLLRHLEPDWISAVDPFRKLTKAKSIITTRLRRAARDLPLPEMYEKFAKDVQSGKKVVLVRRNENEIPDQLTTPPEHGIFLLYERRVPLLKSEAENTTHLLHIEMGSEDPKLEHMKLDFLDQLNRDERRILILHYYEKLTMKEIGEVLTLPESHVSQMHSSIVTRLQGQLQGKHASSSRARKNWFKKLLGTTSSERQETRARNAEVHAASVENLRYRAASEDRRLRQFQRAGQVERRDRFSHELKHLSRAFSEYWYFDPGDEVRKAVSDLRPDLEQSEWLIVPFPGILTSLRGLFQVWCGFATPAELFGPKNVPTSMKQLVRSCFTLMRESLKPLSCTKLSVEADVSFQRISKILEQVDTLWSSTGVGLQIHCEDNVPNPPASWAENYEQNESWMFFTQLLLAIFSDVVSYGDPRKPINVRISEDEDASDHIRLDFTNGVADPEPGSLFDEIIRARKQLRPLAPNRADIKTRQVVEGILKKLSDNPEFSRNLDKAKRSHRTSCKVLRAHLSEE